MKYRILIPEPLETRKQNFDCRFLLHKKINGQPLYNITTVKISNLQTTPKPKIKQQIYVG